MKDEVDFLVAKGFFQIDTIILGLCGEACPVYPKQKVCCFFPIS